MWGGIPGQEQKPQGRPEFLVLFGKKVGFLDLNGNHPQDPGKHITEQIQSIEVSRDWGVADGISKIRSGDPNRMRVLTLRQSSGCK